MSPSKLKIFHIAKWFPNINDDLQGVFVKRHIESLPPQVENHVFYACPDKLGGEERYEVRELSNGKVYFFYYKNKYSGIAFIDRFIKLFKYYNGLSSLIKKTSISEGKPDIIHLHVMIRTAWLAAKFKRKWKVPLLLSEHWSVYQKRNWRTKNGIWKWWMKKMLGHIDLVLPVSENLSKAIQKVRPDLPSKVIYNVVDTEKFTPLSDSSGINSDFTFIHVSDFTEFTKNVKGILNAAKKLELERKDFRLVLIGYGSYTKEIKEHANSLNFQGVDIRFTGKLIGNDLIKEFNNADAFVMFSRYENLPCVLIEAFSMEIPVISSAVGGISEIVNKENGILVESENEDELYKAMKHMMDNISDYNGSEIRQDAVSKFSSQKIGNDIYQIYQSLV